MKSLRTLVYSAILISMYVVFTAYFDVPVTPSSRIRFSFLPLSFGAAILGPLAGALIGGLGDVLAWILSPKGPFFPGLTLSAILSGLVYAAFLYKKPKTIGRVILTVLCVTIFIDLGINTYWMTFIYGDGFLALLPARLIKSAIMLPVQVTLTYLLLRYAGDRVGTMFLRGDKKA